MGLRRDWNKLRRLHRLYRAYKRLERQGNGMGIWAWLKGKKTYIGCAASILTSFVALLNGAIDGVAFGEHCFQAITAAFIRHGVANGKKADKE